MVVFLRDYKLDTLGCTGPTYSPRSRILLVLEEFT
jgi:hypothetical protein